MSYIIQWHQRKQSYMCRLGRNCPLPANLWQVAFFYHFHLEWWSIHSLGRHPGGSLDSRSALSYWAAVASGLQGKETLVFAWPFPVTSGSVLIASIYRSWRLSWQYSQPVSGPLSLMVCVMIGCSWWNNQRNNAWTVFARIPSPFTMDMKLWLVSV